MAEFLRRLPGRLWRLFVDDGWAAAGMLAWIGLACIALTRFPPGWWSGPVLFAGIAAITFVSLKPRP